MPEDKPQVPRDGILGLAPEEFADISVDELAKNKTSIKMLLNDYRRVRDEKALLLNERNTLSTYVAGFETARDDAKTSAILMALGNLVIGFGVNLLTADATKNAQSGGLLLTAGIAITGGGIYFAFRTKAGRRAP